MFGAPGRLAVEERLRGLREELDVDACIVNGENVADGAGITGRLADRLLAAGADVITLGNHAFRRDGIGAYLTTSERVIRPANAGSQLPGRGLAVVEARDSGLLRYVGFSAHSVEAALAALDRFAFDSVLFPFNHAAWKAGFGMPSSVK